VRTGVCAAAIVSGLALVTAGVAVGVAAPTAGFGTVPSTATTTSTARVAPASSAPDAVLSPDRPDRAPPALVDRIPEQLVLPTLGIAAGVVPVPVRARGVLVIPPDPRQVGWWIGGAYPGTGGTVLLAGHVDDVRFGRGALYRLTSLRAGDPVYVDTAAGRYGYRVVARRDYPKQHLPANLADQGGPPRLVLVTCGGSFEPDRGYADNVVVYAEPTTG
jgi:Sortase domain